MQSATVNPSSSSSSPSRRRPRIDSTSSSQASATKRARVVETLPMASAKARGKLPETIDLTQRPSAFQPYTGAKKLVIKNLRAPSHREAQVAEYYARTEKELETALEAVFMGRTGDVTLERLYRGVEDVCRRGNADKVYRMLKEKVDLHLQKVILSRINREGGLSKLDTLAAVLKQWKLWNSQTVGQLNVALRQIQLTTARSCYAQPLAFLTEHICFGRSYHHSTI